MKFATSIVDYIFRTLGVEYLHRHDLAHIKPEDSAPVDTTPVHLLAPTQAPQAADNAPLPAHGRRSPAARP